MSTDSVEFGDRFSAGKLLRTVHELDEILGTSIDNIEDDIRVDINEIIQLNNLIINVDLV